MKTVILAGGLGTRISEESHLRPKPMIEIGGRPILWHIMKYYSHFGHNDFLICCGYKQSIIKEFFFNYYLHMSDVTFDFTQQNKTTVHNNATEPWRVTLVDTGLETMTGGRIKRIQDYIGDETFMLTYGDGVSNVAIDELISLHTSSQNSVTLTAIQPGGRYGKLELSDDRTLVKSFQEKNLDDGGWINGGFMVLEPEIFNHIDGDDTILEREPLEIIASQGKLGAYRHYGFWQSMDTLREKDLLESIWKKDDCPWRVWK